MLHRMGTRRCRKDLAHITNVMQHDAAVDMRQAEYMLDDAMNGSFDEFYRHKCLTWKIEEIPKGAG